MTRRIAGIALLLGCALYYAPESGGPRLVGALVVPAVAAAGVWLVLPNPIVLALAVLALALAHARPGSPDPISAWVYPAVALGAAVWLVVAWRRREAAETGATERDATRSDAPPPGDA